MFTSCTHVHDSGETCKSPAVRGTDLCFHHTPHEEVKRQFPHESEPFELPKIHSKSSLVVAISEVLERFAKQQIKRSDVRTFLSGFGLSARIMSEVKQEAAAALLSEAESEPISESIQQTLDEIAEGLGMEMPTLEEMQKLQASMPNGTPEQALDYWISTGRIRPRQPVDNARPEAMKHPHRPGHNCPHDVGAPSKSHASAA